MSYAWTPTDRQDMAIKPIESSETIPAHWFTHPQLDKVDKDAVLSQSWLYVGNESMIPNAGDFHIDEILGKPILLVRNQSQEVHCFSNVCRHRGGPIATASGKGRTLRCAYHAWTYNLDGELIGTPKLDGIQNFDKKACTLPRYRMESYGGYLFVNFSGDAPPLNQHLQGIQERISPINLKDFTYYNRVVYPVKCNWKVYIDNYMEGYHINSVHPQLANILDVSGYQTELHGHQVLQHGPLAGEDNPYHTDGTAFYYFVFPNLMLNIMPGRVQINSILPVDANHCLTVFDSFFTEKDPELRERRAQDDLKISEIVQEEDIRICELVQKGLNSGTYHKGRLSPEEEKGVWAFHNQLRQAYSINAQQS